MKSFHAAVVFAIKDSIDGPSATIMPFMHTGMPFSLASQNLFAIIDKALQIVCCNVLVVRRMVWVLHTVLPPLLPEVFPSLLILTGSGFQIVLWSVLLLVHWQNDSNSIF